MKELELANSSRYCVFRCSGDSYCLPATSVRNVAPTPKLTSVPHSSEVLAGLAYVHREFLAVFNLGYALQKGGQSSASEHMLVISHQQGQPWGLLVDGVDELASLEVSLTGGSEAQFSEASVCIGSASLGDRFVTVLDPDQLHTLLTKKLNTHWQDLRSQVIEPGEPAESALQLSAN